MEDLRGGIVPELLLGGNCSFQGGIKEVCRKVLGGLGTQVEKGTRGGTQHRVNADRQGQGVLLVTEPHSELNAGLVVVFSSAHPSIFNWSEWTRRCRRA